MKLKKSPFLTTMSIIVILFCAVTLVEVLGLLTSAFGTDLLSKMGFLNTALNTVVALITVACGLATGIASLTRKDANLAFWSGMAYFILVVYSVIMNWITSGFYWTSMITMIIPIVYLAALYQTKNEDVVSK
ncbi:MAG: hypothetical protein ACOYB8_04630 [Eubacteriaceae bacterium]